jgi:hypothetical protein
MEERDVGKRAVNRNGFVCEGMDWIRPAEERIQWQAVVNMVVNIWLL